MAIVGSLNINGLINKQDQVMNFMKYHCIDILLIQEHNIRDINNLSTEFHDFLSH